MVSVSDISFSVSFYKILEVTPNKVVVRVYLEDNTAQTSVYDHTDQKDGYTFAVDIILESGKHGATIIPYMSKSQYGIGLNLAYYHDVADDFGILGLEDIQIPRVLDAVGGTFDIPLTLAVRNNESHITGFHGIKRGELSQDADTLNDFLATTRLRNISDPTNVDNIYGVFSKSYDDFYFVRGKDFDTISTWDYVNDASNGVAGRANNNSTAILNLGTLERGAYVAFVRMKRTAYGRATFLLEENGTTRESYGYNIGEATNTFYVNTNFEVYALPFSVNNTSSYNIDVGVSSLDSGNIYIDFAMVIPLTNGKDYTFDLLLQNLAIFDQEYIGVIK